MRMLKHPRDWSSAAIGKLGLALFVAYAISQAVTIVLLATRGHLN